VSLPGPKGEMKPAHDRVRHDDLQPDETANGAGRDPFRVISRASRGLDREVRGGRRHHAQAHINGRAAITAETATRIATALGTTTHYWLNLQNAIDLYDAQERLSEAVRQPQPMAIFGAA
jgi:hypothetical protein